jgi:phthalate 4,5-cis-dihydrodiol dehydrogenase
MSRHCVWRIGSFLDPISRDEGRNGAAEYRPVGLGMAASAMIGSISAHQHVRFAAAVDTRAVLRDRFAEDFGATPYGSVEALCADPAVEVVYIATPHQFHREHTLAAARHGKHIIQEKPLALSLDDCDAIIDAVSAARVHMIVGHTESYAPAIRTMRAIIARGELGPLSMINTWQYNDFLYRPRRPEELDTSRGGGILFNQLPHQVDIVRLLGGGLLRTVRAHTGILDAKRPTEGSCLAFVEFEDGAAASMVYSGYDFFDIREFHTWLTADAHRQPEAYGQTRRSLLEVHDAAREAELRVSRYAYGSRTATASAGASHFGVTLVSCHNGDMRPWEDGVAVYDQAGRHVVPFEPDISLDARGAVVDEMYEVLRRGKPAVHTPRWAKATLEVSLAILQSARERREISLQYQVPLREEAV